jgi:hypothetical protein
MSLPEFITVWVCEDCGNYYAASSAGDLRLKINDDKETKRPSFSRARCPTPDCATKGTLRVPVNLATRRLQPVAVGVEPQISEPPPNASPPVLPQWSGSSCLSCGGQMVRTGNCETCSSCGSTSGCG